MVTKKLRTIANILVYIHTKLKGLLYGKVSRHNKLHSSSLSTKINSEYLDANAIILLVNSSPVQT